MQAHESALRTDQSGRPVIDVFSPAYAANPFRVTREAREVSWIAQTPLGWMVLAYEDVVPLLKDRRLRTPGPDLLVMQGVTSGPFFDAWTNSLLNVEGDRHTRLRRLVAKAFFPRTVELARPRMREILEGLLDRGLGDGGFDFMTAVARPYPSRVICEILGIPEEDRDSFEQWGAEEGRVFNFNLAEDAPVIAEAVGRMYAYIEGLIGRKRAAPGEDLTSALIAVEDQDDRLSHPELVEMIHTLLFAGHDTTRNQLGLALWTFIHHPEQWRLLAEDPSLASQAVEEVMRYAPATMAAPRVCDDVVEYRDVRFEPGSFIALSMASANRDPAVFEDPDTFDITRRRQAQVTFGGGEHYCLGAALARAEMEEALRILARRLVSPALDGEVSWRPLVGIYGPEALPIRLTGGTG